MFSSKAQGENLEKRNRTLQEREMGSFTGYQRSKSSVVLSSREMKEGEKIYHVFSLPCAQ